ncbi:MAG: hypothetical protein JNM60_03955 [Candidatus Competibacteraceae bacterium]|nr:hypothetical protein [Candidatus Competibacteraceae bacterium]
MNEPDHPSSCHDCCHYPPPVSLDRRRFIRLAALGGMGLLGLATPWRSVRAETGHGVASPKPAGAAVAGQSVAALTKPASAAAHAGSGPAHTAEALLLSCMDYRLIDDIARYMDGRGLTNQYDHIVLAGASLGALTDTYKNWNKAFWDHLKIAADLHQVKKVILMDHRDCGAYKVILKADFSQDAQLETRIHAKFLRDLMVAIHKAHPELEVERLMMNLDGTVQKIS